MTRAEKIRKKYSRNAEFIKLLTGFFSDDMHQMQYNAGVKYAEQKLEHEHFVTSILQSSQYWIWWKNCWNRRDEYFVEDLIMIDSVGRMWLSGGLVKTKGHISIVGGVLYMRLTKKLAIEAYKTIHSLEYLSEYPNKSILEGSYNAMMHQYVKAITKK